METSAPKRRKTSPTTSVQVNESNEPASSDGATRRSSRLNPQLSSSPANINFARSFSEILQQRTSSRGSQRDEEVLPELAASEPGDQDQGSENDLVTAQLELESETGQLQREDEGESANATEQRPKSPVRRVGGGLSMRPRRSPTKPFSRPLPPPSAEEEELVNPFKGRRLRRSPPPGVLPEIEPEEPELPPTPTQKGLSDPASVVTSPPGIHNTPSKRPRRSKALAARINSSPLKQPPLRPPERTFEDEEPVSSFRDSLLKEEPRRKRRKPKPHPARQVQEPDPLADKKALRDALLAEVAQLEDDLRVASRENERLHRVQGESRRRTTDLPGAEEQERILDVLRRHALPSEKEELPDPMRDWLEAAMNPIAFLPFGHGTLPPLVLPEPAKEQEKEEKKDPPTSHHPISMTAEEELPYLQVFTPLTFTSTITTLQQEISEEEERNSASPLLQRHAISVASSPPGLFAATVDMTVDTKTLSIAELAVPRLDSAAVPELGPFIDKMLRGGGGNSALTKNICVVTWAMGEWVLKATRRARFWYALTRELGSAERIMRCAENMRKRTRKGRGSHDDVDDEDGEEDDESEKKDPSKADVIALMGRTSLDLDLPSGDHGEDEEEDGEKVTARVTWRIEFDWTGEARSRIGLLLSAPAKWHARDEKKSLAGLPDMFDKLLAERKDPLEAVKIVVALIVGDGRP
ncbi:hypothetical protein FHL15_010136 [Xylaria flabelliformis]|uniref:Uncharacterized protein n=1 Tax=Xylaria flabelliformis TaxID=2512241 RepID=A0A553HM22_9PEZI|nr:hypothetical protein FHL15_010136 [Xylaria flabelliformis]